MTDIHGHLTLTTAEWESVAHIAKMNKADRITVREQPGLGSDMDEFTGARGRRAYVVMLRGKKDGPLHEAAALPAPFVLVMLMVAPAKESGTIDWVLLSDSRPMVGDTVRDASYEDAG